MDIPKSIHGASTARRAGAVSLEAVLANRWVRRGQPFPHVIAKNVFLPEFYRELDDEFGRIEREHAQAFLRNVAGYDASCAARPRPAGSRSDGLNYVRRALGA